MKNKLIICLTGGIASGKTYVSDEFAEKGACVIDADVLAREVVAIGSVGLSQVVKEFGESILTEAGALNRKQLKRIVFNDDEKLKKLNQILHPLIREAFIQQSAENTKCIEVWVIPLYQAGLNYPDFDRILVVDVTPEIQIQRMQKRDQVSIELAEKILASQPSRRQRLQFATDVISNRYSLAELDQNIDKIYHLYSNLLQQPLSSNKKMQL
ncbi:dephospho-CoA kinase [Marinicella sp. S1101]|uniref:dephospho-CoA kinase n=1 Tax=Marinicella marina TaxID=2996016 RepID=UPI002260F881|nr:dephospho-CoA kinase [Marinicella marina]MCX7553608.1 dephospho-CoA kinase [Marinicella marina]MDJ1140232.1 dephospho-CoA kinase [Marinicella marina]